MRHRMTNVNTGLGNSEPCLLNNKWTDNEKLNQLVKELLDEGIEIWFENLQGCDFSIYQDESCIEIAFGVEPAYQHEKLKIIIVNSNIQNSGLIYGVAFGAYGTKIVKKHKHYHEYTRNCKTKRFIEKWSNKLQEIM